MESTGGSTWIRFNGGNGCTVSPQSNPLYGQRSPVIYGKETDASEGGGGTRRWLDGFLWAMQRPSAALNSCHSAGSRCGWLMPPRSHRGRRRRLRTYFQLEEDDLNGPELGISLLQFTQSLGKQATLPGSTTCKKFYHRREWKRKNAHFIHHCGLSPVQIHHFFHDYSNCHLFCNYYFIRSLKFEVLPWSPP